ncbi:hypothetical protein L9F63_006549, partial [Diploptera punctata]
MDLDRVMDEVGHFGKYQGFCYFLLSFSIYYAAIAGLSYAFTAGDIDYRCHIPQCDGPDPTYNTEWMKNAFPYENDKPKRCERYAFSDASFNVSNALCQSDVFDNSSELICNDWVFDDKELTIVNQWNLTKCTGSQWKRTIVGTVNNVGQLIGFPLAGYFSDRYGRKSTLLVSILVTCVLGLLRSLAWNYEAFLFFEFVVAGFSGGIYNSGFVLGLELVGPKARVIGSAVISCFYSMGMVFLAAIAMWASNWRILQAIYAPGLVCVAYYWLLPESVRWLQSQGRLNEVKEIMKKAAKFNGVPLSDQEFSKFELTPADTKPEEEKQPVPKRSNAEAFKKVFKSKILLARLLNCAFCWITNSFVYIGLSLSAVSVGGDKYTNFMLVAIVEIPAYGVTPILSEKFGRRLSLCGSLLIAGVCCICFAFIPE